MNITNWKLKEISDLIEIVHPKSQDYESEVLQNIGIPKKINDVLSTERTIIEWYKIPEHYKFFLDDKDETAIEMALKKSELSTYSKIILTYGWNQPAVKFPTELFIKDWQDFIASQTWEGLMFSEDFKLIMECSRDYYLHSNFKIW